MTQSHESGKGVIKVRLIRAGRVLRSYKVRSDVFTIGTDPGSTIRAAGDPEVQPKHASIYIDEGELTLIPEPGASVLLNDEQVDFAVPSPTDIIKIGKLTLQVELSATMETIPPIATYSEPAAAPAPSGATRVAKPKHSAPPTSPAVTEATRGFEATRVAKPVRSQPTSREQSVLPKPSGPPSAAAPPKKTGRTFSRPAPVAPKPSKPPRRVSRTSASAAPLPKPSLPPEVEKPQGHPSDSLLPGQPSEAQDDPFSSLITSVGPTPPPLQTTEDSISIELDMEQDAETALFSMPAALVSKSALPTEKPTLPPALTEPPSKPEPELAEELTKPGRIAMGTGMMPEPKVSAAIDRKMPEPEASVVTEIGFSDMDPSDFFGDDEDGEEMFEESFNLAEQLLTQRRAPVKGPTEPYSVAHVIRVVDNRIVDAFGVVPNTPYTTVDGEVTCRIEEYDKGKTSRLILETGPTVNGEMWVRGERRILQASPSGLKTELSDGDAALIQGLGGLYKIEVYKPPLAPKKGQLFSISYPMMALVAVLAVLFHGAVAYALRYIELDRIGDISQEEEEVFAEVIMEKPDTPKPPEEQVVEEVAQDDAKSIAERAPKVSQKTIRKRIKTTAKQQKQQVSSLLNVLSRGSGKAGKSNNLKDLISNIDAVASKNGSSSGFSIAGAIASLPGKGVNVARSGGGGAISTLSGNDVAGKGTGIASLGTGKRKGKVRGKVTKMSSGARIGGSLSREDVLRVINKHIHAIQACYERALMGNPALSGRISMDWTVATTGRVKSVRVRSSTIGSPKVATCISGVIKRWKFPRPKGGEANITFPFLFRSGS